MIFYSPLERLVLRRMLLNKYAGLWGKFLMYPFLAWTGYEWLRTTPQQIRSTWATAKQRKKLPWETIPSGALYVPKIWP